MNPLEPIFLIVAWFVSPIGLGYASRCAGGNLMAFLRILAIALTLIFGIFLANYFGSHLFGAGPVLGPSSIIASLILFLPGWALFEWGESWVTAEAASVRKFSDEVRNQLTRQIGVQTEKIKDMESTLHEIPKAIKRGFDDFSGSVENEINKRFSDLSTFLEKYQAAIEKLCVMITKNLGETKEFLQAFLKPENHVLTSPSPKISSPAFSAGARDGKKGRPVQLSLEEREKRIRECVKMGRRLDVYRRASGPALRGRKKGYKDLYIGPYDEMTKSILRKLGIQVREAVPR